MHLHLQKLNTIGSQIGKIAKNVCWQYVYSELDFTLPSLLNTKCLFTSKTRYLRSGQMRVAVSYDTSQCSHSNYVSVWVAWHSGTWSGHPLIHLMNWIHCTPLPLPCKCSNQCMNKAKLINLIFAWPCIIDINNIDNQLDATIMAY